MYYIYHIPGIKIGCSTNAKRRVNDQGYSNFEILEEHNDIELAAKREIELQKEYGYQEDNVKTNYVQHYEFGKIGRANMTPGKGAKTQIRNKIGMFAYTKEERLALNTKTNIIRARISAEKRRRPVSAFDFKTGKHIADFPSIKDAAIKFNASTGNVGSVINGRRNHTKGYTFKYA